MMGCGLVVAVVLWFVAAIWWLWWRLLGSCGGYFLGCCGFLFSLFKVPLVDVGLCRWWLSVLLR